MPINKKTFCVAPWYSIYLNSDKKLAPCCKFNKQTHDYNSIEEYFHSNELEKVRKDLLNGIKNENCKVCWRDEHKGNDSLRLISNRTIGRQSSKTISEQLEAPKLSNISSFDLTLGNLCNLKCIMCKPSLSSQLLAEANLNPVLKSRHNEGLDQSKFDWPRNNDFVVWCMKYLPQAIHIKFTGGEPFIIPWINDAIECIPDAQKKRCILHFTSNLTVINNRIFNSFKKFKEVWISVSVEGINETHEYLRYGHSWSKLCENITHIRKQKIDNLILKINHVVQSPSYHSIIDMTEFFDRLEMPIHPILLTSPKHFHISSLTKHAKEKFLESTCDYAGFNNQFVQYVRSVTKNFIEQDLRLTRECVSHLSDFDKVRGNDYQKIIPRENIGDI